MFKIDPPVFEAAAPGLIDKIGVLDGAGHQLFAETEYQLPLDGHNRDVPAEGQEKQFDELPLNSTELFQTYRGIDSPLLLGEDSEALIRDAYDRGETFAVERKVQELLLNPVAVDLTPVPGESVNDRKLAVGILEQYAREQSTFKPLITGNALAITLVQDFIPALRTLLGTDVVLAGGYGADGPGGRVAGPGQAWLYITGKITIWRGPKETTPATDYRSNRQLALAEGSYAASVDSFVGAVLVGI
jgi:hypothetical protein